MSNDRITAISTAPGQGGVGMVRISGSDLLPLVAQLSDIKDGDKIEPRKAYHCDFVDSDGSTIDDGILIWYKAPMSYTGEDVIELMGHGGSIVTALLLKRTLEMPGVRLAEPGEYTKRAFLNGKMDLAQAESVIDVINAKTIGAARGAIRSLKGKFSDSIRELVEDVIKLRVQVEAILDFPEEEIDFVKDYQIAEQISDLKSRLSGIIAEAHQGSILRDGISAVLVGEPNVGKSSLMNQLAGDDIAIVTEIAGTTRDIIKEDVHIGDIPVRFIDTAGLRETEDTIEKIGIERSYKAMGEADVVIVISDKPEYFESFDSSRIPSGSKTLYVLNKIDLEKDKDRIKAFETDSDHLALSAKTGLNVNKFKKRIGELVGWDGASENIFMAKERHLDALRRALVEIGSAEERLGAIDLLAEHLKLAQNHLNEITGEFTSDDLLGRIFGEFCIGK